MKKIYSPDNYRAIFRDCPSIVITDEGDIYSGDHFNWLFPGTLLGRVDESAGTVYDADSGLYSAPAYYFERSGDEIRVYDSLPNLFTSPILYIRGDKIYTPDNVNSLFDNPSFYIRDLTKEEASAPQEERCSRDDSGAYSGGYSGGGYAPRSSGGTVYHEPGPIESFFSMVIVGGLLIWLAVAGFKFVTGTVIPGIIEDHRYDQQRNEELNLLFNGTGVEWFSDTHFAITGYLGEIVPKDCQTMDYTPDKDCTVRVSVTSDEPGLSFEAYVMREPDSGRIRSTTHQTGEAIACEAGQEITIVVNRLSGRGFYVADVVVTPE